MAGTSSKTALVSFRIPTRLMPILRRRAIKWCGGNISEYVAYQMTFILTRKHRKSRGLKSGALQ